jgi:hypothetical protein
MSAFGGDKRDIVWTSPNVAFLTKADIQTKRRAPNCTFVKKQKISLRIPGRCNTAP